MRVKLNMSFSTKLGGVVIEGDRELARKRLQQIVKMPEDHT
jgi:hypothetical protein